MKTELTVAESNKAKSDERYKKATFLVNILLTWMNFFVLTEFTFNETMTTSGIYD
ncbi:hypothetical protein [Chryseolinea sp. H1M3-3]|uniref:hypothetical protein n=1 Tax=Chryseolinea sp. H1M3-3 TaxID=3034144 RepID=UPI0023ED032F|nr:hypothetical protein [Chryseolinea sp. H1M3-3]